MAEININDYTYMLPDDRIPRFPLPERDMSKLLVYRGGKITHRIFHEITTLLPEDALLVFNETRVIHARLLLQKDTGAAVEVLLLHPQMPYTDMQRALAVQGSCVWECMIGNKKRWKEGETLQLESEKLSVQLQWHDRENNRVQLRWEPQELHLAEVLEQLGRVPIPPYLGRESTDLDREVYQTVYSRVEGSVAAPTAGLHFTPRVLDAIREKGISVQFITLHVGAGTFQPVKEGNASKHTMHREYVIFTRSIIEQLKEKEGRIIPVGTTSFRSLESLYWFGAGLIHHALDTFDIPQDFPYRQFSHIPAVAAALDAVLAYMNTNGLETLEGHTSIYILPGYQTKMAAALITNFHQPGSTLMLLVAAFIGENWKRVYREALDNDYRFLSYGDSSLLIP